MSENIYLETGEFSTCPNCEADTEDSEEDGGGHWPDSYTYRCGNCGCEYGVEIDEVQHGLRGWKLSIENHGDPRKHPEWNGKLEGKWLDLYDSIEEIEECWDKEG